MFERRNGRCELLALQNHPEHFCCVQRPPKWYRCWAQRKYRLLVTLFIFKVEIALLHLRQNSVLELQRFTANCLLLPKQTIQFFKSQDGGTPTIVIKWSFSTPIKRPKNKMGTWGYNPLTHQLRSVVYPMIYKGF